MHIRALLNLSLNFSFYRLVEYPWYTHQDKSLSAIYLVDNTTQKIIFETPKDIQPIYSQWSAGGKSISFLNYNKQQEHYELLDTLVEKYEPRAILTSKTKPLGYKWSPDGKTIAVLFPKYKYEGDEISFDYDSLRIVSRIHIVPVSNDMNLKAYTLDLQDHDILLNNKDPLVVFDWSPDSQEIAFISVAKGNKPQNVLKINLKSKKIITIHIGGNPLYPSFSHNKELIAYVADEDESKEDPVKRRRVFLKDLKENKEMQIATLPEGNPQIIGWLDKGESILALEGYKTLNHLYKLPVNGNDAHILNKDFPQLVSNVFVNSSGNYFGFVSESLTSLPNAFISLSKELNPQPVLFKKANPTLQAKNEIVKWDSFGGREIEGILVYPLGYKEGSNTLLLLQYMMVLMKHGSKDT